MKTRTNAAIAKIGLIVASVFSVLVLTEVLLRVFSVRPRMFFVQKNNLRLSENPILGYELVPNARGINRWGFRGGDVAVPKPKDTYRILVLGDSIAYGCCDIPLEQTFAKRLESELNTTREGKRYEVLDAGVLGYNTLQEAEYYGAKLSRLDPDIIILQVALNDYLPQTFEFDTVILSQAGTDASKAAYDYYQAAERLGRMLVSSYLVQNAVYAYELVRERTGNVQRPAVLGDAIDSRNPHGVLTYQITRNSWTASDIIPAGMARLNSYIGDKRIPVVAAVFPVFVSDMGSYPLNYRMQHTKIDADSVAAGFHTLDLLSCYQSVWQREVPFDIGDGVHPNAYGHSRAGRCLYNYLTDNQLL